MANYKEIQGFPIQNLSSDPVPYAQELADNPYAGVWSAGGNVNNARFLFDSGVGSLTAGLIAGNSPSPNAETYDGTSWTNISSLGNNTAGRAGAGTSTAALEFGGTPGLGVTEYWDGSSWTELNDLNTGRNVAGGIGTVYTAALCAGGDAPGYVANVESWDGTNWTEVNDLNTARGHAAGVGTQTNAILVGSAPPLALTETWNGTSWTETADLNTGRYGLGGSGASSTDALVFGGESPAPGFFANTESWNGTTWTEVNDMATGRYYLAGAGSSSSAWAASGLTTTPSSATEEWTFSGLPPATPAADYSDAITGQMYYNSTTGQFKAIKTGGAPIGTWASGGSLNTARGYLGGGDVGTRDATIVAGGYSTATLTVSEQYDGSSWAETADLNTGRYDMLKFGTSTAALHCGGEGAPGSPSNTAFVESWNGSAWTETTDMPGTRRTGGGAGTSTAGLVYMGNLSPAAPKTNTSLEWNGSAWTSGGTTNTARRYFAAYGVQTAAHAVAGRDDSSPDVRVAVVEEYDGTTWTELADVNTARDAISGSGISTDSLVYGGDVPATTGKTEFWNGSSWTEVSDMATARQYFGSAGSSSLNALAFGNVASSAATEEWTAADFEIKTMTTS